MAQKYRILIVGGGIAGLATALALRGPNREVTILEQSRMNKEVGALISLQPNASRIANKLGLERFLRNKQPTIDQAFRIYDTTGKLVRTINLDTQSASTSRVCYHRVDLHDSLKEAATADDGRSSPVKIEVASRVVSCDPEGGSVTLESGKTWTADVIVGADGIHSVLRSYVLTDKEKKEQSKYSPKPTGISAYRLILPTSRILENVPYIKDYLDPTASNTHMILGDDKRVVMGPARQGAIFGITALVPDGNMHSEENSFGKSSRAWTSKGSLTTLLEAFAGFPSWLKEVFSLAGASEDESSSPDDGIQALSSAASELALWQLRDMDPLPRWSCGRLVLAGDAAHAMLPTQGQGASQSFEDAEALGEFFIDLQSEHESKSSSCSDGLTVNEVQAFADRYFDCRYRRVSLIQAYSREHGVKAGTTGQGSEEKVNLNPDEFLEYNTSYTGARDWEKRQRKEVTRDST